MAEVTGTTGMALGNIPLTTVMVDKEGAVDLISGASEEILSGVSGMISSAISTVWKAGGSKAANELTSSLLISSNEGKVYNLTTDATTTSDWEEGAGKVIPAGTDVAVVEVFTSGGQHYDPPEYKFNALAARDASAVLSIKDDSGTSVTPVSGSITLEGTGPVDVTASGSGSGTLVISVSTGGESGEGVVKLSDATNSSSGMGDGVAATPSAVASVANDVSSLSGTVSGLSGDISGISGTVSGLSVTVSSLSSGMAVLSGSVYGISGTVSGLSGTVSNLQNFSQVTVLDSSGLAVTNGTLTPGSNADTALKLQAGDNVTLSVASGTKTIKIASDGSVTGAKIDGAPSDLTVTNKKIIIPVASTSAHGVTQLTDSVSNSTTTAITPNAVSGAISGVNSGLATKVSGGTLHTALTTSGFANGVGSRNNTIYALINALHASDNTSEGHSEPT